MLDGSEVQGQRMELGYSRNQDITDTPSEVKLPNGQPVSWKLSAFSFYLFIIIKKLVCSSCGFQINSVYIENHPISILISGDGQL